jgi:hypothetical protein
MLPCAMEKPKLPSSLYLAPRHHIEIVVANMQEDHNAQNFMKKFAFFHLTTERFFFYILVIEKFEFFLKILLKHF